MDVLRKKIESCLHILDRRTKGTNIKDLSWLNDFCAALLEFSTLVHSSLSSHKQSETADMVCLCLSQIMICIRQVEGMGKLGCSTSVSASHQYFLDRIRWCLERLLHLYTNGEAAATVPERSFLKLIDSSLDTLAWFSSHNENTSLSSNILESPEEIVSVSKQLRSNIDTVLSQALGFANVSLPQDKRALSALCQKVIRECNAFQKECQFPKVSSESYYSNLKLKAMTLEQALCQLEDFINDALLRLVFNCFVDFDKFSVEKIRNVLRNSLEDEAMADEFIADFDVNIDRATQIGIFAIAFAPNLKCKEIIVPFMIDNYFVFILQVKTMIRSCLASFESLDTSLIPSLQANGSDLHSDILEQHFNEEVSKFKVALQEIIDSRALLGCYFEILTTGITAVEKSYNKAKLEDLSQMSLVLLEHFQLEVNRQVLRETKDQIGEEYFQQLIRILRECKAILICASQVEPQRIIKRFKILRTILRKLQNCIGSGKQREEDFPHPLGVHVADDPKDINASKEDLKHFSGLTSGQTSILYASERRGRLNRTKDTNQEPKNDIKSQKQKPNGNLLKRESLRTVMFKRQNIAESRKLYNSISNQSADLEITGSFQIYFIFLIKLIKNSFSDILDQLTGMSNGYFEC
ncbi:hypothetical protein KR074_011913 [Drosophila pseudoananassae]|nr:hypothetical protein KR074_011913 [Drosophila pseudoananassae]